VVAAAPGAEPLVGFTVAVTADRRRDELGSLLRRRGARVVEAPLIRIAPVDDDADLRAATERCLAAPLDYAVATTGVGWRGWMSAVDGFGLGEPLREQLRRAQVLSRGPKATGAVRACGLREVYSPESEANEGLLAWLREQDLAGRRVALQEHGAPLPGFVDQLRDRGAEVISVPVYRWLPALNAGPVHRLIDSVVRREVDAVTFTSAPAAAVFLETAAAADREEPVVSAFGTGVLAACIGPVCARPLQEAGIQPVWPDRGRLGKLVQLVVDHLGQRGRLSFRARGLPVAVQGNAVVAADRAIVLAPAPAAVLRALAAAPGRVLSRRELLRRAWWPGDVPPGGFAEHTVDAAVARLRAALGDLSWLVSTVNKRGYRLEADH
jgi:uroporphyrinogen-III synthase